MSDRNVVLVCGGRDFRDEAGLHLALDTLHNMKPITRIVEGGQRTVEDDVIVGGADYFAKTWASKNRVDRAQYDADWKGGKSAGPLRNQRMLNEERPDLVLAAPGGKGTADMVTKALRARVHVIWVG